MDLVTEERLEEHRRLEDEILERHNLTRADVFPIRPVGLASHSSYRAQLNQISAALEAALQEYADVARREDDYVQQLRPDHAAYSSHDTRSDPDEP